jgi:hypothetical protein
MNPPANGVYDVGMGGQFCDDLLVGVVSIDKG